MNRLRERGSVSPHLDTAIRQALARERFDELSLRASNQRRAAGVTRGRRPVRLVRAILAALFVR
jgi:hypothetical protein